MTLESTFVPIPSEVIIPPAAYLRTPKVRCPCSASSWPARRVPGWVHRSCTGGRALGPAAGFASGSATLGFQRAKLELAERWCARYESAGVFFSRLLPVIRHLDRHTGRVSCAWTFAATRSPRWPDRCSGARCLAWLGETLGQHPELLAGSLHRFFALVLAVAAVLAALYYIFVHSGCER